MSSNPQWKMDFQPPPTANMQDIIDMQQSSNQGKSYRNGSYSSEFPSSPRDSFASQGATGNSNSNRYSMGTYGSDSNNSHNDYNSSSNTSQHYDPPSHPNRETGIIEKLLVSPSAPRSNRHSYGFIQCCERQARLFFHFSQFSGNIEHLKIGDPVEFEMTYDRRTGKPIASTVVKIAPEVVLSEARVTGTVTTELRGEGVGDSTGRISYENRGECFFLPYTKDDVEGNVTLHSGDAVSFQIATNQRGNLGACHVRLENPAHPVKYHGVVCSMKESFGFIERADVVKEIFFHFSEAKVKDDINLGDDVEFIIQTRNGKEVACFITRLPSGSVIFEDVAPDITKGQVLKPLERGSAPRHANDPLPGRIRFRAPDHSETDVQFGDKDQLGEFTLRHGDWVQFQVATDRRDQLKRATYISLLDESFNMSGERREKGVVSSLKDGFGFIRCVEREPHLFFHFSEVLLPQQPLNIGDEVEFTLDPVTSYSTSQQPSAKRIKHLPPGTVQFENLVEKGVHGVVSKEAVPRISSPSKSSQDACGLINYLVSGAKKSLSFFAKDVDGKVQPRQGEKVIFDIFQVKRTKELIGMNIVVQHVATNGSNGANSNGANSNGANPSPRPMLQGFIAALKDGFGFIETKDHDKEVFFHFSNFEGSVDILELGRDVEYILGRQGGSSGGCCSAELVRAVPKGTISVAKPTDIQLQGNVTRTLRALNPDQREYSGIIEAANGASYEFGIMGLSCKRDLLRIGDPVSFYVDTASRAANIVPVRKKRRAIVDSIKGGFGFLSFEIEEGKKLIFYMSDVNGPPNSLQPGDVVEFILVTNHRNGKSLACNVTKIVNFDGEIYDPNKDGGEQSTARCSSNSFGSAEVLRPITKGARRNEQQLQGIVTKVIKPFNSEQPQVNGIIEATNGNSYEFILLGLACKRELFRNGDTVTFQLDLQNRATNIVPVRKKKRGTVETIKGTYGFIINPDSEDGKKLLFYTSEVRGPPGCLQPGDQVEYTVVTNQRNNKTTACNITKVVESSPPARPERLISRLRTASLEEQAGPRLVVVRKPRGPDGTRGFRPRVPINPENPFQ